MPSPAHRVVETIRQAEAIDPLARRLGRLSGTLESRAPLASLLGGVGWLGHPLHPVMTDQPIGLWTSAVALDVLGGERTEVASDILLGLGIAAAVPTAASGLIEYGRVRKPVTRLATVHAATNTFALGCMSLSFVARRTGHRGAGRALAMIGSLGMVVGGHLGGHLAYGEGVGVEEDGAA
jgi:uncharacterized membrane protein